MFVARASKVNMVCIATMLAFLYIYFFASASFSQENRPKVGIVLSGGGAKGMAHIGVIRALEENGIPIDYIAGTSVGAIVGGLYASGYTPDEMEAIFNSPKFSEWLKGLVDEKYIAYFKKDNPTPDWIQPSLKIDSGGLNIKIPTNFISPLLIDYEFLSIYSGVSAAAKGNFDSLFVPFRCAAADLNNQKAYYFQSGNLGLAIRASMTFPFVFNPIMLDSIIFFDGGIYDNFPVKSMQKDFNPDIIIGSKVAENFPPPKEGDLLSYLQKMIAQKTDYDLGGTKGIILLPNLQGGLNITDFSEVCSFSEKGYQCAIENMDSINKLVPWKVDNSIVQERRKKFVKKIPPLIIDSISIKGVNKLQETYVRQLLGSKKKRSYTVEQMRDYYFRLFSDPNIKYIHPTLTHDTVLKAFILELNMQIESTLTPKIGGYISAGSSSEAFLQVDYRRLQRVGLYASINTYLGRFYNSIKAASRIDIPSNLPFYIAPDYTFNDWDYFSSELLRAEAPSLSYLTQNEQHLTTEIGFPMTKRGKFSLQPSLNREEDKYIESNIIQFNDNPNKTIFMSASLALKLEQSTLNKPQYPSLGQSNSLILTGVLGQEYLTAQFSEGAQKSQQSHQWVQAKYNFNKYVPFNKYYSLGLSLSLFASSQKPFLTNASTLLHTSSFSPTVESSQRFMPEYRANAYAAPGLQGVVRFGSNFQVRTEAYVFLPAEINLKKDANSFFSLFYDNIQQNYQFVISAGFVYHSYIGPISLIYNYYSRDTEINPSSIILNIGYVFFNKRGLER